MPNVHVEGECTRSIKMNNICILSLLLAPKICKVETSILSMGRVTDGGRGECLDPGENGAILDAGGVEKPGPPGGGKNGQLASDSGGS
jgi:hypothetical protein